MIAGLLGAAISGVNLNSQRVSVAANNIANVSTPGYQPETVTATSVVSAGASPGGVQSVTRSALVDLQGVLATQPSNTDIATEFTNLILAEHAYSASLKSISVAEDMSARLLDVIG